LYQGFLLSDFFDLGATMTFSYTEKKTYPQEFCKAEQRSRCALFAGNAAELLYGFLAG